MNSRIVDDCMNGFEVVRNILVKRKIDTLFSGSNELFFSFKTNKNQGTGLKQVLLRHEQAVVHSADGYARASGNVGVAFVSAGFGFTNTITSLATAHIDSIPIVLVVVKKTALTKGSDKNYIDIQGMTISVVKQFVQVATLSDLEYALSSALMLAQTGRPGPVLLEITEGILHETLPLSSEKKSVLENDVSKPFVKDQHINLIYKEIQLAKKPVIFVGGGVVLAEAADLIRELVQRLNIPIVSTLMGLGTIQVNHPLFLGMLGMHGTFAANKAVHHADLLLCFGLRFSDRVTGNIKGFSPHSKKIQIDIDPAEVNKNVKVDISIIADVKDVVTRLLSVSMMMEKSEWTNEVTTWKKEVPRYKTTRSQLKPQEVIKLLDKHTNSSAVVTTDVGQHQIWTALNYRFQFPRQLLTSGGLGTMGFGLPAAIGAAIAKPTQTILCVTGDGSIQMNLQELMTAVSYNLPIKIAILKNGYLGMVRQWQELFYQSRYSSVKISSPNFVSIAKAYHLIGFYANNKEDAEDIIAEAMNITGPVIMEFDVTEEENVYPIVPPGFDNINIIINK